LFTGNHAVFVMRITGLHFKLTGIRPIRLKRIIRPTFFPRDRQLIVAATNGSRFLNGSEKQQEKSRLNEIVQESVHVDKLFITPLIRCYDNF
jgi:hypothetical protein